MFNTVLSKLEHILRIGGQDVRDCKARPTGDLERSRGIPPGDEKGRESSHLAARLSWEKGSNLFYICSGEGSGDCWWKLERDRLLFLVI